MVGRVQLGVGMGREICAVDLASSNDIVEYVLLQ